MAHIARVWLSGRIDNVKYEITEFELSGDNLILYTLSPIKGTVVYASGRWTELVTELIDE